MFEIYSYMFTSGLFSAQELSTYIGYGLTEAQYHEIVGDKHEETNQATEGQANGSKLQNLDWAFHARKGIVVAS